MARNRPRETDHPSAPTAARREYGDIGACGHGDDGDLDEVVIEELFPDASDDYD